MDRNLLFEYFNMLGLGHFLSWGCCDILFEDTRDRICSVLGCF